MFQSAFAKESTLKYHNQEWYCEACKSKFVCYWEFTDHGNLDHWLVKNLRPNWTAKIPLEAFEKVDEASTDREHNVDDTLLKKTRKVQRGRRENLRPTFSSRRVRAPAVSPKSFQGPSCLRRPKERLSAHAPTTSAFLP